MLQENLACRVQPDAARQTFEQGLADFLLNLENPAVQRCRGDGELVGGLADRALAGMSDDDWLWGVIAIEITTSP